MLIPEAAFKASELEGFVPQLLWSRRISIGMDGVRLQFRHLLLLGVNLGDGDSFTGLLLLLLFRHSAKS